MRHPLWTANSILVLICVAVFIFIILSRQEQPTWDSLQPAPEVAPARKQTSEINIQQIYENDLFDTYEKAAPQGREHVETIAPLPAPPIPKKVNIPEEPKPVFLQPLDVSLKGILYVANDDSKHRATIIELKTKHEHNYKVGDFIEDAQLIKIFSKKIILLRANGQQEVLYLRASDAEQDPTYAVIEGWEHVAQPIAENRFIVSVQEFTHRIKDLAQFIDLLDLTTAYQRGISIGCRVGNIKENSLGIHMGLRSRDIITKVQGMPITDTDKRFAVYKKISALQTNDEAIRVDILRNGMPLSLDYVLSNFTSNDSALQPSQEKILQEQQTEEVRVRSMKERHKFAPTIHQIEEEERKNMRNKHRTSPKNLTSLLS